MTWITWIGLVLVLWLLTARLLFAHLSGRPRRTNWARTFKLAKILLGALMAWLVVRDNLRVTLAGPDNPNPAGQTGGDRMNAVRVAR